MSGARRRTEAKGGDESLPGSSHDNSRARAAAVAAGRRRDGASGRGLLGAVARAYQRADEVVSMPFLLVLGAVLAALVVYGGKKPPDDPGEGEAGEWGWLQGRGQDVVGKVNCTTYLHRGSGAVLELGHGSGGGFSFRRDAGSNVSWVWHDGRLEAQEKLACPSVEGLLRSHASGGKAGKPKGMLYNRYNKVFWVGEAGSDGSVVWRNVNNPVKLELVKGGFRFQTSEGGSMSLLGGVLREAQVTAGPSTVEVEANEPPPRPSPAPGGKGKAA